LLLLRLPGRAIPVSLARIYIYAALISRLHRGLSRLVFNTI
jgi:hypothetical protein